MFSEYYADYKLEFAFPVAFTLSHWPLYVTFISSKHDLDLRLQEHVFVFSGAYDTACKVHSDCQLGFVCISEKCSCDSSYVYDPKSGRCKKCEYLLMFYSFLQPLSIDILRTCLSEHLKWDLVRLQAGNYIRS